MSLQKIVFATLVMLFATSSQALDLGYPELQVVPSAEDRLKQAQDQKKSEGFIHRNWQILLPATALILSGASLSSDQDWKDDYGSHTAKEISDKESKVDQAALLQMLVGASFVGLTYYWDKQNTYGSALEKISKMSTKSKKLRLKRARYAEESLYSRYDSMRKLKWILGLSTLGFAMSENDSGGKTAKTVATLAAVSGFVPILYKHRYESNYLNYEKYKKRIYGPVAQASILVSSDRKLVPALGFNLQF